MTLAVSAMHRTAEGCGERTMVLRDFMAIRILKMAVEVGFVDGIMAATTPRGDAISTIEGESLNLPTVRRPLNRSQTSSAANLFFSLLSSGFPNPVSSWAMSPSLADSAKATRDILSHISSTFA
jgi:hypothetical protein